MDDLLDFVLDAHGWLERRSSVSTLTAKLAAGGAFWDSRDSLREEAIMEFLVEFDVDVPPGTPDTEVEQRQRAESVAAAELADEGHLVRLWRRPQTGDGTTTIGLYRGDSAVELDGLLSALPLADWLHVTVTPLDPHPNDPAA